MQVIRRWFRFTKDMGELLGIGGRLIQDGSRDVCQRKAQRSNSDNARYSTSAKRNATRVAPHISATRDCTAVDLMNVPSVVNSPPKNSAMMAMENAVGTATRSALIADGIIDGT